MSKIRERNQRDKIKNQGKRKNSKPAQQKVQRVMTAKLKKELAQQKRGGGSVTEQPHVSSATTEAVDQVEQTTEAAVYESGHQVKRGISRAVTKAKKERQEVKRRQNRPEAPEPPSQTSPSATPRQSPASPGSPQVSGERPLNTPLNTTGLKTYMSDSPTAPKVRGTPTTAAAPEIKARPDYKADTATASAVPSSGDRMLQQAVDKQREQFRYPKRTSTLLDSGDSLSLTRTSTVPKGDLSPQNQSINPSIKERPRRSAVLKEKPPGGGFTPRTRPRAEQAVKNAVAPTNGKRTSANLAANKARQRAKREAQRSIFQRTKQTARNAANLSKKTAIATTKAVKALIGTLSALMGGIVLVAALCVIFLVAAVIASPFGILFANEPSPGAVPLNVAVSQINMELTDKLSLLQAGTYDSIDIQGAGPDWREVTAVFACKTAMGADSVDVAALTPDRVERLKAVFWDMCSITSSPETIDHPAVGSTAAWSEKVLHITIAAKTADDMWTAYLFNSEQNSSLTELLAELGVIGDLLGDLSISQESVTELLSRLPADLSPERRAVVETACKLVGKVTYFWGGKSRVIGWDSRWGTLQKVWASGNFTSGTYRPFGLDCSGFADWVFYNISGGSYILGHGGGAHAQHTYCTPITWAEAQPGDLVFYPNDTHVGIVGGWDESGNIQIIHCTSSYNNVVITGKAGFATIGRPMYYTS
ncbi:C40 family peptidase [Lawsonibacter sp. JLR.KK007]|uniref:C40 family peptidase n=1 Tax=Lawsonibacter sp. JLR.KK007 TaxID=3114293 RepID=UPI002FEE7C0D